MGESRCVRPFAAGGAGAEVGVATGGAEGAVGMLLNRLSKSSIGLAAGARLFGMLGRALGLVDIIEDMPANVLVSAGITSSESKSRRFSAFCPADTVCSALAVDRSSSCLRTAS